MDRTQKESLIASLNQLFGSTTLVVVAKPLGLTVAESTDLRRRMREAGASYKVAKNRLIRIALKGTQFEGLSQLFAGPTAIAYSRDPVAAARVAVTYADRNEKLKILGAGLGARLLDVAEVTALAKLPSLDELRARLLGMVQTPAARIAQVLQAPGAQLARVLNAHAQKDQAA
jgi:large subunit ribosomal protein L10